MIYARQQSSKSRVTCEVLKGSVLGPVLFRLYAADVLGIAERHGINPRSYADDTQVYFHLKAADISKRILELNIAYCGNIQLDDIEPDKLNANKTQSAYISSKPR